ncbi:MAG: hypothetical protein ACRDPG_06670, partial [Nocardioidaceae bacterium]
FPVNNEAPELTSIAVNPQKVGDLLVVSAQEHSTTFAVTTVSGGGAGPWTRAIRFVDTANTLTYEIWYARVTSPGSATVNFTYSGDNPSLPIEIVADSFTGPPGGTTWSVVASGGSSNPASSTVAWPSLTSGSATYQLYWGASEELSSGQAGSTPGFTYSLTDNDNTFLYDGGVQPGKTYQPSSVESPVDVSTAAAVIFSWS